jgi:hypothetical protein
LKQKFVNKKDESDTALADIACGSEGFAVEIRAKVNYYRRFIRRNH